TRFSRDWSSDVCSSDLFGGHWRDLAEGFCDRGREVGGLLLRYEALTESDFDRAAAAAYLGFELDPLAQKVLVGASPPGEIVSERSEERRVGKEGRGGWW